jgi:hypothetical protein
MQGQGRVAEADAHFKNGVVLLRECRHTEAEACFREAMRIDPRLATPWVGLSQIQAERGDIASSFNPSLRNRSADGATMRRPYSRCYLRSSGTGSRFPRHPLRRPKRGAQTPAHRGDD